MYASQPSSRRESYDIDFNLILILRKGVLGSVRLNRSFTSLYSFLYVLTIKFLSGFAQHLI